MKDKVIDCLYKNCWETRSSRFNAARRLQRRSLFANLVVSIMSAALILISIVQSGESTKHYITLIGVSGALVILVVSLWEMARNSAVKAERLHLCAMQLTSIYNSIKKNQIEEVEGDVSALTIKYEEIIKSCPENHEPIDYNFHKINCRSDYEGDVILSSWHSVFFAVVFWHLSYLDTVLYTIFFIALFVGFGVYLS